MIRRPKSTIWTSNSIVFVSQSYFVNIVVCFQFLSKPIIAQLCIWIYWNWLDFRRRTIPVHFLVFIEYEISTTEKRYLIPTNRNGQFRNIIVILQLSSCFVISYFCCCFGRGHSIHVFVCSCVCLRMKRTLKICKMMMFHHMLIFSIEFDCTRHVGAVRRRCA